MNHGLGVIPDYDEPRDTDLLIRQSTIESMMLCPARLGYSTSPGYDHIPSEPMAFGSVVHAVIEDYLLDQSSLRAHTPDFAREQFYAIAERDGYDLDSVADPTHISQLAFEAVDAFQSWVTQWWARHSNLDVLAIEQRMERALGVLPDGRAVWAHGTPDLLDREGMVDWKTAGRGWAPGKGEVRIQSPTYLWLAESLRGRSDGRALYAVYDRSSKQWKNHKVNVTPDQVQAALKTLWEYARAIDAQVFPPTPAAMAGRPGRGWWCSAKYCGAWNICEYKALVADNVDVYIARDPKWL